MKVIFLDVDGVLNSIKYELERDENDPPFDRSRIPLIKRIVTETGAKIVLSSSWRRNWENGRGTDWKMEWLVRAFSEQGVEIFGKTGISPNNDRAAEIREWLSDNPDTERYAVIDDIFFGWEEHSPYVVITSERIGRGLEEKHVEAAVRILNGC